MNATSAERVWFTKDEAAAHVRVRPRTIDRWANEGRITRYKVDGMQSVRFARDELDQLIQPSTGSVPAQTDVPGE